MAGIPVTWIVPHEYTQNVPNDVDYRTMLTFLEFYETFVKFALFKLYHSENLKYPPALDAALDAQACRLHALRAEALDAQGDDDGAAEGAAEEAKQAEEGADADEAAVKKQQKASKKRLKSLSKTLAAEQAGGETAAAAAEEEEEAPGGEQLTKQLEEALLSQNMIVGGSVESSGETGLFHGLKFFLSRECRYSWLEFAVLSFGGAVGWDGESSPYARDNTSITHLIHDRPSAPQTLKAACEYVQPQWIVDSINAACLLPVERYVPGATLPPHLSPFVDDEKEGYIPEYRQEMSQLKSAAEAVAVDDVPGGAGAAEEPADDMEEDDEEEEEEEQEEEEQQEEEVEEVEEGIGEDEEEEEEEEEEGDAEEMTEGDEKKELSIVMMSKKAKRLYGRMQHGLGQKAAKVENLKRKARGARK